MKVFSSFSYKGFSKCSFQGLVKYRIFAKGLFLIKRHISDLSIMKTFTYAFLVKKKKDIDEYNVNVKIVTFYNILRLNSYKLKAFTVKKIN